MNGKFVRSDLSAEIKMPMHLAFPSKVQKNNAELGQGCLEMSMEGAERAHGKPVFSPKLGEECGEHKCEAEAEWIPVPVLY